MIPYLQKGQGNTVMNTDKEVKTHQPIVYQSEIMKETMKMVSKVAQADSAVLIYGASGTGKELVARKIHEQSYRKHKPFVILNCSCLNEETADSELFGHEKGSFTGAHSQTAGLLEQANGGTIVLDEVADLHPKTQARLLRFLQDSEIRRVGGKLPIHLDVRVICSTNKNLSQLVSKELFREDLFYRINIISLSLPSLAERTEDIIPLLYHFLGKKIRIEKKALDVLMQYKWSGNIRELKNLCERLRIFCQSNTVKADHLPHHFFPQENKIGVAYNPNISLSELNKTYILSALNHFPSKREAAKALGITVKTLYNRLHEYEAFDKYTTSSATHQIPLEGS